MPVLCYVCHPSINYYPPTDLRDNYCYLCDRYYCDDHHDHHNDNCGIFNQTVGPSGQYMCQYIEALEASDYDEALDAIRSGTIASNLQIINLVEDMNAYLRNYDSEEYDDNIGWTRITVKYYLRIKYDLPIQA